MRSSRLYQRIRVDEDMTYEQMDSISSTGFNLGRREFEHARVDALMEMRFPNAEVESVEGLFRGMTKVRFLQAGATGVAALVDMKELSAPVVVKITRPGVHLKEDCLTGMLKMVCRKRAGGDYNWQNMHNEKREAAFQDLLSAIEHEKVSPHFLHTHLHRSIALRLETNIEAIATWLGARKSPKTDTSMTRALHLSVMEYGGCPAFEIATEIMTYSVQNVSMLRSMLMQVVQGLCTMVYGAHMHHNDLHLNNVLGSPTQAGYLYYMVQLVSKTPEVTPEKAAQLGTRLFRVPTHNTLYRIIDFGAATSTLFHKHDHAIMARAFDGGPQWEEAVDPSLYDLPLEMFDMARVLTDVLAIQYHWSLSGAANGAAAIETDMKAVTQWIQEAVREKGLQRIRTLHKLPPVTKANEKRVKRSIGELQAACDDHGMMLELLLALGERFGYDVTTDADAAAEMTEDNTYTLSIEI